MITVAIIGILSAIAYSSYQQYVRNSKEAEAKTALVSFASAMGQYYLDGLTYAKATAGTNGIFSDKVPIDGGTKTYTLSVVSATKTAFKLKATPVDTNLKTFCIDHLGTKDDCSGTYNW